jgi:hypothetical protein
MPFRILTILSLLIFLQIPCISQGMNFPFRPVPNAPYFQSPQFSIDSVDNDTIVLCVRSPKSGPARLFWAIHYDPQFNPQKSISFMLKPGTHDYYFNVPSQNPHWIGWIKGLLLYPENGPEGIEVVNATIRQGNLSSNIRSGWQEFWGPKGRKVIGSTINITSSSTFLGRTVNTYIYWLTGIFFLAALAWLAIKGLPAQKKGTAGRQAVPLLAGRRAIYFALAAWVLLAINADINYFNIFRENFAKYFGKSIEEKRAIAYGRDYYDFLVFARNKLPQTPVYFGAVSSRYAADLQARIYLVPHILTDPKSPQAAYLLIFHPGPKQLEQTTGFSPFARLNKNAYILKMTK